LNASAERCALLGDAAGDVTRTPITDAIDPAVDIRGVRAGTNAAAFVLEIDVSSLSPGLPEGVDAQRWSVTWNLGSNAYRAEAQRDSASRSFTWSGPDGALNQTTGILDTAHAAVEIVIARSPLSLVDGAQLTELVAHAADLAKNQVETQGDDAPDQTDAGAAYVAGVGCSRQALQLCPVVADRSGDAGPIVTYDGRSLPENQDALDLLSGGAETDASTVTVSLRIRDVTAAPPAGYDSVGYTVSWHRSDGRRFYAEAYGTAGAMTFTYGIDAAADDGPSGALFGGVATTGLVDAAHDIVKIDVPRDVIGTGSVLSRFGASSWALMSGNTAGTYKVIDTTPMGAYHLGVSCGA
jgi:hypothetical protein